jgi:hypothetical protein
MTLLKARLHPIWVPKVGYRYSVIFDGKLLVERSSDPECDAPRAGRPRTIIDIEQAARLCVKEGPLRFTAKESRPEAPQTAESNRAEEAQGWRRLGRRRHKY